MGAVEERKESAARFMSIKTGPNVQVNPAQAGVSLIPLDDFSSVDTTANNLAHMVRSKEARLSLTQKRGNQELSYQVNAIKQGAEISRIGNLDWDKELKHWVRRKPWHGTDEGEREGLDGGPEVLAP